MIKLFIKLHPPFYFHYFHHQQHQIMIQIIYHHYLYYFHHQQHFYLYHQQHLFFNHQQHYYHFYFNHLHSVHHQVQCVHIMFPGAQIYPLMFEEFGQFIIQIFFINFHFIQIFLIMTIKMIKNITTFITIH